MGQCWSHRGAAGAWDAEDGDRQPSLSSSAAFSKPRMMAGYHPAAILATARSPHGGSNNSHGSGTNSSTVTIVPEITESHDASDGDDDDDDDDELYREAGPVSAAASRAGGCAATATTTGPTALFRNGPAPEATAPKQAAAAAALPMRHRRSTRRRPPGLDGVDGAQPNTAAVSKLPRSPIATAPATIPEVDDDNGGGDENDRDDHGGEAPSDEEDHAGHRGGSGGTTIHSSPPKIRRYRTSHGSGVGRLSPVKLKTAWSVQPSSIRVYHDAPTPPAPRPGATTESSCDHQHPHTNADAQNRHGGRRRRSSKTTTTTTTETAAVAAMAVSNFAKLKLQVAVAAKHAVKQRAVQKMEDRVHDVEQHRHLWQQYQQIVHVQQQERQQQQSATATPLPPGGAMTAAATAKTAAGRGEEKKERPKRSKESIRRPSGFFGKRHAAPIDTAAAAATTTGVVDYDLEVDVVAAAEIGIARHPEVAPSSGSPPRTSANSSRRRRSSKSSPSRHKKTKKKSPSSAASTHHRTESFDLQESKSWYFDFQDEFDAAAAAAPAGTVGSSGSQADLSLLSASSMEAQRRLYAEKRRLRKLKAKKAGVGVGATEMETSGTSLPPLAGTPDAAAAAVEFDLVDHTPVARNCRSRRRDNASSHSVASSSIGGGNSRSSSHGYGPVRRRGAAQQLLAATGDEKLRLAAGILKSRSVTNMEVAFSPEIIPRPDVDGGDDDDDNASLVSDLDDTVSYSSLASGSHYTAAAHNHDYGPRRRSRAASRRNGDDNGGGGADQSSIASSTDSFDHHRKETAVVYDHKSVVQRRLDIEARLKALLASDDDNSVRAVPAPPQPPPKLTTLQSRLPPAENVDSGSIAATSPTAIDAAGGEEQRYSLPAVVSPVETAARSARRQSGHDDDPLGPDYYSYLPQLGGNKNRTDVPTSPPPAPLPPQQVSPDDGPNHGGAAATRRAPAAFAPDESTTSPARNDDIAEPTAVVLRVLEYAAPSALNAGRESCESPPRVTPFIHQTTVGTGVNLALVSPTPSCAVNESFESTESQGAMQISLPYLDPRNGVHMLGVKDRDDVDSMVAHPSSDSGSEPGECRVGESRRRNGANGGLKHPFAGLNGVDVDNDSMTAHQSNDSDSSLAGDVRVDLAALPRPRNVPLGVKRVTDAPQEQFPRQGVDDTTRSTLLLADQVEAHVMGILERYRNESPDDQPPRIAGPRTTTIGSSTQ